MEKSKNAIVVLRDFGHDMKNETEHIVIVLS